MPDRLFTNARLAAIYDDIDFDRSDLDHYEAILVALGAVSVLDVGCGTGVLACRLAGRGMTVIGVDPALASIEVARAKPLAELVTWLNGDATVLPSLSVDVATMTGNVAQVFLTDDEWRTTLIGVRSAVRDGGHFVFESRDPGFRGWEQWQGVSNTVRETSDGPVEYSIELKAVDLPMVSFRLTYRFLDGGDVLTSDSTLRFRERDEIVDDLATAGFDTVDVRGAPDRPGREFVFVARGL